MALYRKASSRSYHNSSSNSNGDIGDHYVEHHVETELLINEIRAVKIKKFDMDGQSDTSHQTISEKVINSHDGKICENTPQFFAFPQLLLSFCYFSKCSRSTSERASIRVVWEIICQSIPFRSFRGVRRNNKNSGTLENKQLRVIPWRFSINFTFLIFLG